MTDQPGNSPWSPNTGGFTTPGADAPTAMPTAAASTVGGPPPERPKANWLRVVVAINAVIVLIGAVVIAVLLTEGGDGSDVAIVNDGPSTSSRKADSNQGRADDASTTTPGSSTTLSDGPVVLAPEDTTVVATIPRTTFAVPAPTAAPVTLPPPPAPPPTEPPASALPGPDDALGQVRTTLTEFMDADSRNDIDSAMTYLALPVDQWVVPENRNYDSSKLRADIGDSKSADIRLSLVDGPSLAFGPESTADGGWMIKVNYTMHSEGSYLKKSGETQCFIDNETFLDTLVASPGGTPRISSHEQTDKSGNLC